MRSDLFFEIDRGSTITFLHTVNVIDLKNYINTILTEDDINDNLLIELSPPEVGRFVG